MQSYDVYVVYVISHIWVITAFCKKCVIAHYSRMEQNLKSLNPQVNAEFYEKFNVDNENWFW